MNPSALFWLAQRRTSRVVLGTILVSALVLVIEAVFVLSSGFAFRESILGGRIQPRTVGLFIYVISLSAVLFHKFADRATAFRIAFALCVIVFSLIACRLSLAFFVW